MFWQHVRDFFVSLFAAAVGVSQIPPAVLGPLAPVLAPVMPYVVAVSAVGAVLGVAKKNGSDRAANSVNP